MLNILHINSFYSQRLFYGDFYEELNKHIENTIFIPVNFKFQTDHKYPDNVQLVKCYNSIDRLLFFGKQKKIYNNLKGLFSQKKFNLIHAHSLVSNGLAAYKLNKTFDIPYVVTVRATDVFFFMRFIFLKPLINKIINNASAIIFVSEALKIKFLKRVKASKINLPGMFVIPNWLGNHFINQTIESKQMHHPIKILQISELIARKNIKLTIKAIRNLRAQNISLSFTIIGKPTSKRILKYINNEKTIDYFESVDHDEILSVYNSHDIFIMPSVKETFGIVYLEASSQGLPIVYTLNDGIYGLEKGHRIGVAIKPKSVNINKAIIDIINDYSDYSRNAINFAQDFSLNNYTKSHLSLYLKHSRKEIK